MMTESQYQQPAEWYDRIYAGIGKDYDAEAAVVDGIIRTWRPAARSVLDVGCGTGLHLEAFTRLYDEVAGIDLDPRFVELARTRCGGSAAVAVGDMRSFDLRRRFDAVTCLFSAVGHLPDADALDAAVAAMAQHLEPGGVLVIEPWILPGRWRDGTYGVEIAEAPDSTLIRANHSASEGLVSVLTFAWTEVSAAGVQRMDETLRLTRFSEQEYAAAFDRAGLSATFDEAGINAGGRGLWIGTLLP